VRVSDVSIPPVYHVGRAFKTASKKPTLDPLADDIAAFRRRIVVSVIFFGVLIGCIGLTIYQVFGPPVAYREHAWDVMRAELASLPPYPGSMVESEGTYGGAFHYPGLEAFYTLPGTCADVHSYYGQIGPTHGWTHDSTQNPSGEEVISAFHKVLGSVRLTLELDCFVDQSKSPGYDLDMQAP
jgi:hypothetical protein